MLRKGTRTPDFSAHIERLEDRQVMSVDPLGGLLGDVNHQIIDDGALPVEHAVVAPADPPAIDQQLLAEPDFWIDPNDAAALEGIFDQVEQALTEAHNQTGWFNVRNDYGFTGRGQTVAVIDSGIAWDHFALGGGLGSNYRVVGGWDFTEENDANPYDDGVKGGHGTHVSGIIGNNSSSNSGVAPGVDFVGLRVFNDAGAGYFSWVEKALQWVYDNRDAYENPITTVNLSLGVSSWNAATIPQWANLEDEFARLESVGIFIAVSAGNSFGTYNTPGLSYPASSQYVVPVMSTDDNGALSYFSQRLGRAIAAPGRSIVSTIPDYKGNKNGVADDFATMSGTSMAAPYIAGASVIIREAMEFVGRTGITQDMIYDHMMATADTIYDAATKLSYKRLDLDAAIDALMPADDFGSTATTAHNLGAISGTTSISGAIGALTDADYFRFTATASGNVTFDLTSSTGGMAAAWQVYDANGQPLANQNGSTLSFAAVAGQSYTVRLTSTGSMGHYSFDVSAASSEFVYQDWGSVAYSELNNIAVAGEAWYRVQTTRDGLFTAIAQFNAAGGNVQIELYNANRELIAAGAASDGTARVDAAAAAGTEFFIRVTGANSEVDFKLVNLVSHVGSTVTVRGTEGDDAFTFTAGAAPQAVINGVVYTFDAATANTFTFNGGAGNDTANLYDSAGDDTFLGQSQGSTLKGAGYSCFVTGVESVYAYSTAGGNDTAELWDSAGNDVFTARPTYATLRSSSALNSVHNFENVYGYAAHGGRDFAFMYDSADDDVFISRPTYSYIRGAGFYNFAKDFESVRTYSTAGGNDVSWLFGSTGNDTTVVRSDQTWMYGDKFDISAHGFASTRVFGNGGHDVVRLQDLATQDAVYGTGNYATLTRGVRTTRIENVDHIIAMQLAGMAPAIDVKAVDYLFEHLDG
jgi:subtilisin family serine protease